MCALRWKRLKSLYKVLGMCYPESVTTLSWSCGCCHWPWLCSGVCGSCQPVLTLLSSPSHTSCCRCHCPPAARGEGLAPLQATSRCRSRSPPQAPSHLTPCTASAHYHPRSADATGTSPEPGGLAGEGSLIVPLWPMRTAERASEWDWTWRLKASWAFKRPHMSA